jgi:hypothetical protein
MTNPMTDPMTNPDESGGPGRGDEKYARGRRQT